MTIVTFRFIEGILYGTVKMNCSKSNENWAGNIEFNVKTKILVTGTPFAKAGMQ